MKDKFQIEIFDEKKGYTRSFTWDHTPTPEQLDAAHSAPYSSLLKPFDDGRTSSLVVKRHKFLFGSRELITSREYGPPKWTWPRIQAKGFGLWIGWRYTAIGVFLYKPKGQ